MRSKVEEEEGGARGCRSDASLLFLASTGAWLVHLHFLSV